MNEVVTGGRSYFGVVRTLQEAHAVLEGSRTGVVPRITRRLTDSERVSFIVPGAVFIWEEEEAGIRRWTDNIKWGPSRVCGSFLCYTAIDNPSRGDDTLTKQSFCSVNSSGVKMHLIAYTTPRFLASDGGRRTVCDDPLFRHLVSKPDSRITPRLRLNADDSMAPSTFSPYAFSERQPPLPMTIPSSMNSTTSSAIPMRNNRQSHSYSRSYPNSNRFSSPPTLFQAYPARRRPHSSTSSSAVNDVSAPPPPEFYSRQPASPSASSLHILLNPLTVVSTSSSNSYFDPQETDALNAARKLSLASNSSSASTSSSSSSQNRFAHSKPSPPRRSSQSQDPTHSGFLNSHQAFTFPTVGLHPPDVEMDDPKADSQGLLQLAPILSTPTRPLLVNNRRSSSSIKVSNIHGAAATEGGLTPGGAWRGPEDERLLNLLDRFGSFLAK